MAEAIINGTIRIDTMANDPKKITVQQGKDKFSFWLTKKDGSNTKAYDSWLEVRPMPGDLLDVQYKEEDAEFTNDAGKLINFKRRTILQLKRGSGAPTPMATGFSLPSEQQIPIIGMPQTPGVEYVPREEYEAKIKEMAAVFMKVAVEVSAIKNKIGME